MFISYDSKIVFQRPGDMSAAPKTVEDWLNIVSNNDQTVKVCNLF